MFSMILLTLHFAFKEIGKYSVSFTQFAPALAVLFIAMILKDQPILLEIKKRFSMDTSVMRWIIPVIAIPSLSIVISGVVLSLFNFKLMKWEGNPGFYLLSSIAILLGCIAEEIGWRGFLLRNLQKNTAHL